MTTTQNLRNMTDTERYSAVGETVIVDGAIVGTLESANYHTAEVRDAETNKIIEWDTGRVSIFPTE